jgi:hypothetical protein
MFLALSNFKAAGPLLLQVLEHFLRLGWYHLGNWNRNTFKLQLECKFAIVILTIC